MWKKCPTSGKVQKQASGKPGKHAGTGNCCTCPNPTTAEAWVVSTVAFLKTYPNFLCTRCGPPGLTYDYIIRETATGNVYLWNGTLVSTGGWPVVLFNVVGNPGDTGGCGIGAYPVFLTIAETPAWTNVYSDSGVVVQAAMHKYKDIECLPLDGTPLPSLESLGWLPATFAEPGRTYHPDGSGVPCPGVNHSPVVIGSGIV